MATPKSILEAIKKSIRIFLYTRDKKTTHSFHLVYWNTVCVPKSIGGLEIKVAYLMNRALRVKLAWRILQEQNEHWVATLRQKYCQGCKLTELLSNVIPSNEYYLAGPAHYLKKCYMGNKEGAIDIFRNSIASRPPFEEDPELAQLIVYLKSQNISKVQDFFDAYSSKGWKDQKFKCYLGEKIPSNLSLKWDTFHKIVEDLHVFLCNGLNRLVWREDGIPVAFTIKRAYASLLKEEYGAPTVNVIKWENIWNSFPKIKLFLWLVAHRVVLTFENLRKWGICSPSRCYLYNQSKETIDHQFVSCRSTQASCSSLFNLFQVKSLHLNSVLDFFSMPEDHLVKKLKAIIPVYRTMPLCILRYIWLARSDVYFKSLQANPSII
eukprot:Gb_31600 [translate_table: standard]